MALGAERILEGLKLIHERVKTLDYVPPRYLWVVTFNDGQALPQFDPETGKQNRFPFQDQSRITKIGWFPISVMMAARIFNGEGVITEPNEYPNYEITLKPGQLPYMRASTRIPAGQYHECLECGVEWIFSFGKPDPNVVRQGYQVFPNHKIYCVTCAREGKNTELERALAGVWYCPKASEHRARRAPVRRYQVAVCPSCGYHNLPTDKKEDLRIVQKVKDMSYLIYKIGVQDGTYFEINQWGEVVDV